MGDSTIFPDVELEVVGKLRTALAAHGYPSIRVANTYKGVAAGEVWVRRDGGPVIERFRDVARIAVNVFAPGTSSQPVTDLARAVSALVRGMADGDPIVKVVQTGGPSPIPDTLPRMYLTFEVTVRGADLT